MEKMERINKVLFFGDQNFQSSLIHMDPLVIHIEVPSEAPTAFFQFFFYQKWNAFTLLN